MEPIDPGLKAKTPPVPRKRPLLLYVMMIASISLVVGTVLLSNDMRHLRSLLRSTGQEWLIAGLKPAESTPIDPAPKPSDTPKSLTIDHPRLFAVPEANLATGLRRMWQMTGPDMCRRLRDAGAAMSKWEAAAISASIFECSWEKVYASKQDRPTSSAFVIVRGDARGRITSMRAKMVDPPKDKDGRLDPSLVSIFETMLTQSRWDDVDADLTAIRSLHDIRKDGFGASMSFAHEVSDARNFNFMLVLKATTAEQKRLNDLFRADNGFDLPQDTPAPQDAAAQPGPVSQAAAPVADVSAVPLPRPAARPVEQPQSHIFFNPIVRRPMGRRTDTAIEKHRMLAPGARDPAYR